MVLRTGLFSRIIGLNQKKTIQIIESFTLNRDLFLFYLILIILNIVRINSIIFFSFIQWIGIGFSTHFLGCPYFFCSQHYFHPMPSSTFSHSSPSLTLFKTLHFCQFFCLSFLQSGGDG